MSILKRRKAPLFALLTVAFVPGVQAADLYAPRVSPEPVAYGPYSDWTGFHIGATYGYATGWTDVSSPGASFDIDTNGGNASIFAGYDWQFGRGLFGLETDIGFGDLGGSENGTALEINSVGSIRARLGYLMTPSFLVYGTAGFAYADFDFAARGDNESEIFTGYQIGAGTELKFSEPWSLRLEYVYTDLGSETLTHNGLSQTYDPDYHTVRAGLSFKF